MFSCTTETIQTKSTLGTIIHINLIWKHSNKEKCTIYSVFMTHVTNYTTITHIVIASISFYKLHLLLLVLKY